ncbi:helix-turn-helix transcriptional regulator [Frankia sp. Cr1]|uniref:helix-turn-helix transcriptional regulator n=1 Tax=Frankia sp. Cr1 TaxID=3073931 RepID=UPI002AD53393|nr:AAA family ATPase [Frankia sp. Cr1]
MDTRGTMASGPAGVDSLHPTASRWGEPLLERADEVAVLRAAVGAARRGGAGAVVVQGPPGMGKTRLLAVAESFGASCGLRVLAGRGRELERQVALGVAVDLLAPPVAAADQTDRARLFAGLAAPAAALFTGTGAGASAPPDAEAVLLGLCWLTANLTGWDLAGDEVRPVLLTVDDAQWADAASLRFLTMLADRADRIPLVLVVAVRDGEAGADAPALRRLAVVPQMRLLTLAPLSAEAVSRLVTHALPTADGALVAAVAHASGGNPFLVGELVQSLHVAETPAAASVAGLVPDTVVRSVLARLARLPADAGRLAASAAVLGDGTPLRRVAAHAALDLMAAERAADALATAHLLRPGDPLTFVHPLVGAAVYADQPAFARTRAHRRAADILAAEGEGAERVAGHLLVAAPEGDTAVVRVLREAAGPALSRGDPAAAARLLDRALAEPAPPHQRGALLIELARAQLTGGDTAAHTTLSEGLALLRDAPARTRADALGMLAQICHARGDAAGAAAASGEALDLLDPHDPAREDLLAGYLAIAMFHPSLVSDADRRMLPVLRAARQGRPPSRPPLLAHVTLRLALAGDPASAVRHMAARALADDPLLGPDSPAALIGLVVHALVIAGELAAADAAADAALATARERGDLLAQASASYHRALSRFQQGALTAALADLEAAQTAHTAGWTVSDGWIYSLLAVVHLERGDRAAAHEALGQANHVDPGTAGSMDAALVRHARARLALAEHDPAAALADACAAGRHLDEIYDVDHPGLLPWRTTAALAAYHLGDHAHARQLAGQAVERARQTGVAQAVGAALRVAGLVAGSRPDIALLTEAAGMLRETPAALEHAITLVDLGAALRRTGQREECRQPLRHGLALADRMHARPLAERARAELDAVGVRPRRTAVTGIDALTPAERRVALLALHGNSNSQIAQGLFVTIKTVETHLARAYRKLGIAGRRQLHDVFASGADR